MQRFPFQLLVFLVFTFAATAVFAQPKYSVENKRAVKSYENALQAFDGRNSDLALKLVEEAIDKEPGFIEAYLLRFEIYAETRNLDKAAEALRDAVAIDADYFPNAWYFLGTLELKQGKYEDAARSLTKFMTYRNVNPELKARAAEAIESCEYALHAMANPVDFDPENMGAAINSEDPEYYPCLTADGRILLYTRLLRDPEAFKGKNEDFFVSRYEDGAWQPSRPLHEINTLFNEGAPSISADGRVLVFTACEIMGDYGPGRKGFGSCDLFIARRVGNRWSQPENLGQPVNSKFWETQPSLSPDGNTLYFVRGRQTRQGIQDQDIYVTRRLADDTWSRPEPLPPAINTQGKEESVMIHPDGETLYFASNGHPGMGGMDLFVSRKDANGQWQQAENLGYPINTHNDENSLHVGPDGEIALFASDREGGFGGLDLYSFTLPKSVRPVPVTYAEGVVVDDLTGKPVEARLELFDVDGLEAAMKFKSDPLDGTFLLSLPTGKTYGLSVKAEGYLYHSENFVLERKGAGESYAIEVRLKKPSAGSAIVLRNVFFDTDKDVVMSRSAGELKALAEFLEENPGIRIRISGHTDDRGGDKYNLDLSQRRAEAVKTYLTEIFDVAGNRVETRGYGSEKPIASNDTEEGRALNRRTEFEVVETP